MRYTLKEISLEYSLEGLMLRLKLQYFGHLMRRGDSFVCWFFFFFTQLKIPWRLERLRAGGDGDVRGWDGWMASPTQWTWVNSGSWWWTGRTGALQSMGSQRVGHDWATELNWTEGCSSTAMSFKNVFLVPMWKTEEKVKEMEQRWLSTAVNPKPKVWGERPFNIVTIMTDKMGGMWWIFEN